MYQVSNFQQILSPSPAPLLPLQNGPLKGLSRLELTITFFVENFFTLVDVSDKFAVVM